MGDRWLNKLVPFDASVHKPIDLPTGRQATEYTSTSIDPISKKWMVHPSIWFNQNGDPVHLNDDDGVMAALYYEISSGNKFPRFSEEKNANIFAGDRTAKGGGRGGLLAMGNQ